MDMDAKMLTTGNQLRAARALVDMDQTTLATRAGVNINTIGSMEKRGGEVLTSGLDKIKAVMTVLEAEGIEFLNHGQPGVRIRSEMTYGFLYDDQKLVGRIQNGELRSDRDDSLIALVRKGRLHDPESGEPICGLAELGPRGHPLPSALKERMK
jgi:hypothetical protein